MLNPFRGGGNAGRARVPVSDCIRFANRGKTAGAYEPCTALYFNGLRTRRQARRTLYVTTIRTIGKIFSHVPHYSRDILSSTTASNRIRSGPLKLPLEGS